MIRINKKQIIGGINWYIEDRFELRGAGRRRAISISKTRKITANKKNRSENGRRALFFGSNPHSKGEAFSRSFVDFEEIIMVIRIKRRGMILAMIILIKEDGI